MTISINLPDSVDNKYDIKIERGILNQNTRKPLPSSARTVHW